MFFSQRVYLSLRSLMQWLIRAHFKHGYSPLISTHTLPIPLSPIAALIMRHLLGDPPPPPTYHHHHRSFRIHPRELLPSITTGTFAKSALKSIGPFKMVRFHYRSHAVKPRQYRAFANHCFGSTLRSISNTFTSHILCLSYAYRVITRILFTHCDSQYLTLEVGMEWPLHTSRACALRHALHGGIVYEYESIRLSCTLMILYSCS